MGHIIVFGCILLISFFATSSTHAQALDSYVPPDLFGTNTPIEDTMPDDQGVVEIKKPKQQTVPAKIKPQKIKQKKSETPIIPKAVKVESKMQAVKEKNTSQSPSQKIAKPNKKPTIAKVKAKQKPNGIVKGPKTMPAVQKEIVESEVMFTSAETASRNITASAPQKAEVKEQIKSETKVILNPDQTEWVLDFAGNNKDLSPTQVNLITDQIVPHLSLKENSRLTIEAAPSYVNGDLINAGRRIALSRALKVRSILMKNNIKASQLVVRTLDLKQTDQQMNQVIISLIN